MIMSIKVGNYSVFGRVAGKCYSKYPCAHCSKCTFWEEGGRK